MWKGVSCEVADRCMRLSASTTLENIERVTVIKLTRRKTVRTIARSVDISTVTVYSVLSDNLKLRKVQVRWMVTAQHKTGHENRVKCVSESLLGHDPVNFWPRIVRKPADITSIPSLKHKPCYGSTPHYRHQRSFFLLHPLAGSCPQVFFFRVRRNQCIWLYWLSYYYNWSLLCRTNPSPLWNHHS